MNDNLEAFLCASSFTRLSILCMLNTFQAWFVYDCAHMVVWSSDLPYLRDVRLDERISCNLNMVGMEMCDTSTKFVSSSFVQYF